MRARLPQCSGLNRKRHRAHIPVGHQPDKGTAMSNDARIELLRLRHRELDQTIRSLESDRSPDWMQIRRLKRDKLRLLDTLERLTAPRYRPLRQRHA